MKIISIEPTPSPNTMKILLDEELPMGKSNNYKKESSQGAPEVIQNILTINGVKGVYHVADFLAVERNAKYDWKEILHRIRHAFGEEAEENKTSSHKLDDHFGEISVQVQIFKGIPMQVKLSDGNVEKRFGLPSIFTSALTQVQKPNDNVVLMRRWKDYGVRYGDLEQVGRDIVEELLAAFPEERLNVMIENENSPKTLAERSLQLNRLKLSLADLDQGDWRVRYRLLEQMEDPDISDLPLLEKALQDEKASIRRLATVYLGMIKDEQVLPLLYRALKDKTVTVRRTAGDCLSDLGFPEAMTAMMEALKDDNKLVRWRAAMFLFEVGDDRALSSLKAAVNDPEFEVSLQINMAIERIEGGTEALGSVWKQMTEARNTDKQ
ncbi:virulence factor [Bacillus sp. DNRA2]|uniref:conserved virulence factor C family protein n=1 Tax=Bacillus sp. DNRA2 TaxID=2723053 RepID=UPI00145ECE53|nr:conserved virulence factor C family protein [Bacillus sp. DNRA2]NMD72476.1 virulence factor [Bacillus sp. DNRA2]